MRGWDRRKNGFRVGGDVEEVISGDELLFLLSVGSFVCNKWFLFLSKHENIKLLTRTLGLLSVPLKVEPLRFRRFLLNLHLNRMVLALHSLIGKVRRLFIFIVLHDT